MERRWLFPFILTSVLCAFLLFTSFNMGLISNLTSLNSVLLLASRNPAKHTRPTFIESMFRPVPRKATSSVPRIAYLVSGSKGDLDRLWRALRALYHPRNHYVVHLDRESELEERTELSRRVSSEPTFRKVGNVYVIEKANMVTYRGPTMVANTLHACAILLRKADDWDWFINLSASDYPLVTQDDILHTFKSLPRNLNFVEHTSRLGWKAVARGKPLIVDPGLYMSRKSELLRVVETRQLPNAFKLFTGSAWMALTRDFVEFCIWGYDNLPRTLLMYYTNFVSTPEGYFHTVICNSPNYSSTVVNHDLHYISWDVPPKQHPRTMNSNDMVTLIESNAPFARKFPRDGPILDKIDAELLGREEGGFTPGEWCSGSPGCLEVRGDWDKVRPGNGSERLGKLIDRIVRSNVFEMNQCR